MFLALSCHVVHRHLHSFPTRRSSDLNSVSRVISSRKTVVVPTCTKSPATVEHQNGTPFSAAASVCSPGGSSAVGDRKSTRLNSSHPSISYAVFCLKKKKQRSYQHLTR